MWCSRPSFQLHSGAGRDEVMSSTLVETVSINYEDFSESFLTCGTCLCSFDGCEHTPKLLPCSHTVCLHCLTRIVASHARSDGTFRCPICRESIRIPSGGVAALPPSFLVNQLLDLMSTQRREVIPKCSLHSNQELLFCESCDLVFCTQCSSASHQGSAASQHTIIPLSIAIKRMSEILCYKANECYSKLNEARDAVTNEMHQLDHAKDATYEQVNKAFQAIIDRIEKRRDEVIASVTKIGEEKKKILLDQIVIIESERQKVRDECDGLQYQVEVRNITKKIAHLNNKIDSVSTLIEPRENSFLRFDPSNSQVVKDVEAQVKTYGRIVTSKTFPSLCFMKSRKAITHLRSEVIVYAVDYNGDVQTSGGDPVEATIRKEGTENALSSSIVDNEDGTYSIFFTPVSAGTHLVSVSVFGRQIKDNPLQVEAIDEHNPDIVYGSRGSGKDQFQQPVGIAIDEDEYIYIADTGNSRIKVISSRLKEVKHIVGDALEGRSVTGLTLTPQNSLIFCNWRKKSITEVTPAGELLSQFSHESLQEPTTLSVNPEGEIFVVDNASNSIFVFLSGGKLVRQWGTKGTQPGQLGSITAITCGQEEDVIVADSRIQVFSEEGQYQRSIFESPVKGTKGTYGGLFLDPKGLLLATRQEKSQSCIQVFDYTLGSLIFVINSAEAKLKRPSGLATTKEGFVVIVDLGNDCIKKFRYM